MKVGTVIIFIFGLLTIRLLELILKHFLLQGKSPGMKYQTGNYVPVMSRGGGSHSGGPFAANRAIPSVQVSFC